MLNDNDALRFRAWVSGAVALRPRRKQRRLWRRSHQRLDAWAARWMREGFKVRTTHSPRTGDVMSVEKLGTDGTVLERWPR